MTTKFGNEQLDFKSKLSELISFFKQEPEKAHVKAITSDFSIILKKLKSIEDANKAVLRDGLTDNQGVIVKEFKSLLRDSCIPESLVSLLLAYKIHAAVLDLIHFCVVSDLYTPKQIDNIIQNIFKMPYEPRYKIKILQMFFYFVRLDISIESFFNILTLVIDCFIVDDISIDLIARPIVCQIVEKLIDISVDEVTHRSTEYDKSQSSIQDTGSFLSPKKLGTRGSDLEGDFTGLSLHERTAVSTQIPLGEQEGATIAFRLLEFLSDQILYKKNHFVSFILAPLMGNKNIQLLPEFQSFLNYSFVPVVQELLKNACSEYKVPVYEAILVAKERFDGCYLWPVFSSLLDVREYGCIYFIKFIHSMVHLSAVGTLPGRSLVRHTKCYLCLCNNFNLKKNKNSKNCININQNNGQTTDSAHYCPGNELIHSLDSSNDIDSQQIAKDIIYNDKAIFNHENTTSSKMNDLQEISLANKDNLDSNMSFSHANYTPSYDYSSLPLKSSLESRGAVGISEQSKDMSISEHHYSCSKILTASNIYYCFPKEMSMILSSVVQEIDFSEPNMKLVKIIQEIVRILKPELELDGFVESIFKKIELLNTHNFDIDLLFSSSIDYALKYNLKYLFEIGLDCGYLYEYRLLQLNNVGKEQINAPVNSNNLSSIDPSERRDSKVRQFFSKNPPTKINDLVFNKIYYMNESWQIFFNYNSDISDLLVKNKRYIDQLMNISLSELETLISCAFFNTNLNITTFRLIKDKLKFVYDPLQLKNIHTKSSFSCVSHDIKSSTSEVLSLKPSASSISAESTRVIDIKCIPHLLESGVLNLDKEAQRKVNILIKFIDSFDSFSDIFYCILEFSQLNFPLPAISIPLEILLTKLQSSNIELIDGSPESLEKAQNNDIIDHRAPKESIEHHSAFTYMSAAHFIISFLTISNPYNCFEQIFKLTGIIKNSTDKALEIIEIILADFSGYLDTKNAEMLFNLFTKIIEHDIGTKDYQRKQEGERALKENLKMDAYRNLDESLCTLDMKNKATCPSTEKKHSTSETNMDNLLVAPEDLYGEGITCEYEFINVRYNLNTFIRSLLRRNDLNHVHMISKKIVKIYKDILLLNLSREKHSKLWQITLIFGLNLLQHSYTADSNTSAVNRTKDPSDYDIEHNSVVTIFTQEQVSKVQEITNEIKNALIVNFFQIFSDQAIISNSCINEIYYACLIYSLNCVRDNDTKLFALKAMTLEIFNSLTNKQLYHMIDFITKHVNHSNIDVSHAAFSNLAKIIRLALDRLADDHKCGDRKVASKNTLETPKAAFIDSDDAYSRLFDTTWIDSLQLKDKTDHDQKSINSKSNSHDLLKTKVAGTNLSELMHHDTKDQSSYTLYHVVEKLKDSFISILDCCSSTNNIIISELLETIPLFVYSLDEITILSRSLRKYIESSQQNLDDKQVNLKTNTDIGFENSDCIAEDGTRSNLNGLSKGSNFINDFYKDGLYSPTLSKMTEVMGPCQVSLASANSQISSLGKLEIQANNRISQLSQIFRNIAIDCFVKTCVFSKHFSFCLRVLSSWLSKDSLDTSLSLIHKIKEINYSENLEMDTKLFGLRSFLDYSLQFSGSENFLEPILNLISNCDCDFDHETLIYIVEFSKKFIKKQLSVSYSLSRENSMIEFITFIFREIKKKGFFCIASKNFNSEVCEHHGCHVLLEKQRSQISREIEIGRKDALNLKPFSHQPELKTVKSVVSESIADCKDIKSALLALISDILLEKSSYINLRYKTFEILFEIDEKGGLTLVQNIRALINDFVVKFLGVGTAISICATEEIKYILNRLLISENISIVDQLKGNLLDVFLVNDLELTIIVRKLLKTLFESNIN